MLTEAGLDLDRLDPAGAWTVFKEFAAISVDGIGSEAGDDMLMFDCGPVTLATGEPCLSWMLTRQFSVYADDGGYHHMEQLVCYVCVEKTADLEGVSGWVMRENLPGVGFEDIEREPAFSAVLGRRIVTSGVEQEWV